MGEVKVNAVYKTYAKGRRKAQALLRLLLTLRSGLSQKESLCALKGVTFSVAPGEVLGIIGRNGSGKSTLLRIIARIIDADRGDVVTKGKVVAFLNFDAGMKPQLTLRENVILFCTLLGMSEEEIKESFERIITFCELASHTDSKWHSLSDGMRQRVILGTVLHTKSDVLLLDESLSSGDREFRSKGVRRITELARAGTTVILTSHSMPIIEAACDRVLWLHDGNIKQLDHPAAVIQAYKEYEEGSLS